MPFRGAHQVFESIQMELWIGQSRVNCTSEEWWTSKNKYHMSCAPFYTPALDIKFDNFLSRYRQSHKDKPWTIPSYPVFTVVGSAQSWLGFGLWCSNIEKPLSCLQLTESEVSLLTGYMDGNSTVTRGYAHQDGLSWVSRLVWAINFPSHRLLTCILTHHFFPHSDSIPLSETHHI